MMVLSLQGRYMKRVPSHASIFLQNTPLQSEAQALMHIETTERHPDPSSEPLLHT